MFFLLSFGNAFIKCSSKLEEENENENIIASQQMKSKTNSFEINNMIFDINSLFLENVVEKFKNLIQLNEDNIKKIKIDNNIENYFKKQSFSNFKNKDQIQFQNDVKININIQRKEVKLIKLTKNTKEIKTETETETSNLYHYLEKENIDKKTFGNAYNLFFESFNKICYKLEQKSYNWEFNFSEKKIIELKIDNAEELDGVYTNLLSTNQDNMLESIKTIILNKILRLIILKESKIKKIKIENDINKYFKENDSQKTAIVINIPKKEIKLEKLKKNIQKVNFETANLYNCLVEASEEQFQQELYDLFLDLKNTKKISEIQFNQDIKKLKKLTGKKEEDILKKCISQIGYKYIINLNNSENQTKSHSKSKKKILEKIEIDSVPFNQNEVDWKSLDTFDEDKFNKYEEEFSNNNLNDEIENSDSIIQKSSFTEESLNLNDSNKKKDYQISGFLDKKNLDITNNSSDQNNINPLFNNITIESGDCNQVEYDNSLVLIERKKKINLKKKELGY